MFSIDQLIHEHFPALAAKPGLFSTTLSRVLRLILREKDFAAFARYGFCRAGIGVFRF